MSYRNPQTVIDTESAKYYAQAISSIGQSTVKALNTRFAKAQAIKKSNLKGQADLVKFSSGYLKDINKSLKDFNITPQFRKLLDGEVNKAAQLRQQLANINLTGNDRLSKQNELNALETFFDVGLSNALENLKGERDEISAKQVNLGQEGGLSASATNPQVLNDINDTFNGNPKANYDFNIIRDDSGALNVSMTFLNKPSTRTQDGKDLPYRGRVESVLSKGKDGEVLDLAEKNKRTYNLNSDFTPQSLIMNPVINKGVSENLENEKITLNGAIDLNSEIVKGMLDGKSIIKSVDKNNVVKEYEVDNLNIDKFKNTMLPGLKAQITGVIKQGRASSGDMGSGLVGMQSWTDDVLGEDIDLEPSAETDHGLTPESYKKLTDAILDKKHRELQDTMPRLREVGIEEKETKTLTPNQQLTQDQLQKSYDEGKGFVDNFVNNIFPHDKSVKNADMGKVVAELQNMGLVIKDQKPGGAFTLLDPDGGDGYLISPNSSIYENKLSLLNALGRKKLLIAKPKNTSDLPIFNN
jgi:hypothetical protein